MNKPAYNPQPGSVAWKVIEFLTTHPDEYLSTDDVAVKFEKPPTHVHSFLGLAVEAGVLTRKEELSSGGLVYRLGAGHPAIRPNPSLHPSLGPRSAPKVATPSATPRRRRSPVCVDITKVKIDQEFPMPIQTRGGTDWPSLIKRLDKVGASFAVPGEVRHALGKQLAAYKKSHPGWAYTLRLMGDGTVRVWRTA